MKRRTYSFGGRTEGLRFAILARVSTDKQAERGSSLSVQVEGMRAFVRQLGGQIVNEDRYRGSEHATPGYERKLLTRLLEDAALGLFDAVMVYDFDRWSRGNRAAEEGLDTLKACGVRFFVGREEKDIEDEDTRLMLGVQSNFNKAAAAKLVKKGQMSRIHRALRGWPTAGMPRHGNTSGRFALPYARILLNPAERSFGNAQWGTDSERADKLRKVAEHYLEPGVTWADVEKRFGETGVTWLRRMHDAGDLWVVPFKRLNVKPEMFHIDGQFPPNLRQEGDRLIVTITIPRILDEATRRAVLDKSEAQQVSMTKEPATQFALRGYVKCAQCGSNLNIHHDLKNSRVYMTHHSKTRQRGCTTSFGRFEALNLAVVGAFSRILTEPAVFNSVIADAVNAQRKAKPKAATERDEALRELRSRQSKVEAIGRQFEDAGLPRALRDALIAQANEHQQRIDALRARVKQLDSELRVVEIPPEVPQLVSFLRDAMPKSKRALHWPNETKRALMHFFFGVPHRKPLASSYSSPDDGPLAQPGVYVERVQEGGEDVLRWEARGWFGVVAGGGQVRLAGNGGGRRMDPAKVADFFRAFPFDKLRHPDNPLRKRGRSANIVQREETRWSA